MEIEGKIILDLPEEGGTSKAGNLWRKKSWVLETFGQYPRKVKFDLFGDRIDQVRLEAGKSYKVSVDAESHEFNGRCAPDRRGLRTGHLHQGQPHLRCPHRPDGGEHYQGHRQRSWRKIILRRRTITDEKTGIHFLSAVR